MARSAVARLVALTARFRRLQVRSAPSACNWRRRLPLPPVVNAPGPRAALRQRSLAQYWRKGPPSRSEEHTSELQSLMRISYAVFCLKKKIKKRTYHTEPHLDE